MDLKQRFFVVTGILLLIFNKSSIATISYNDGQHHIINTVIYDNAKIDYQSPNMRTILDIVQGGEIGAIEVYEDGMLRLDGGRCDRIVLYGNGVAYLNGRHGRLGLSGNSKMHIYYSSLTSSINVTDYSELIMYGYNLKIDEIPYEAGTYKIADLPLKTLNADGFYAYVLSGYFENGSEFRYYFAIKDNAQLTLIPEPITIALFGLGGLLIRRR